MISSTIGGADGPTSIFLAGFISDLFIIPAITILIIFYVIYFTKQISQKRQGIQTRQLGRRKEKNIRTTEILLSLATVTIVPVQLISIFLNWSILPTAARIAGIVIGIFGDVIFLTAVRTMKNSWRAGIPDKDKTEFISNGIYQYSRNPAFLGFDLMYTGILLMYFNLLLFIFTIWLMIMLHLQIKQEEAYLSNVFRKKYLDYKRHTQRYFGRKNEFKTRRALERV